MGRRRSRIKTLLNLGVASTLVMYAFNRRIFALADQKHLLKTKEGFVYKWKHGDIYYEKAGDESLPALLLIHNIDPASSGMEWEKSVKLLSSAYQVYTIDLPGCGRSDKPNITYTNYYYALAINSFIENVIGRPAFIAATELSSSAAVTAAFISKANVAGLVMINPTPLDKLAAVPEQESRILRLLISLPVIGTVIYNIRYNHPNLEHSILEKQTFNPFLVSQQYMDGQYEAAHLGDGNGKFLMTSIDGRYVNYDIRRFLVEGTTPIAIIYSDQNPDADSAVLEYQKLAPQISVHEIEKSVCLPQLEVPETFVNTLKSILFKMEFGTD